jgi:hypothetical protein
MESVLTCFGDIVGTQPGEPSDSGLYITDLEMVGTIKGIIDADAADLQQELEDKLKEARRIAILKLHTDLTTLMQRYAKPRPSFSGLIGSKYHSAGVLNDVGKSGVRILCRAVKDAEIVLKGINTIFNESGEIKAYIANNYNDDVITIDGIQTVEKKLKNNTLAEEIRLPLWHEDAEGCVEYYVYHENELQPINTRYSGCSSCRSFRFDAAHPVFKHYGSEIYVNVAGFNGEPETLGSNGLNTSKGLQLKLDIICRTDKAICRDRIHYENDPHAMSYAQAIQHKAGSAVIWNILRSPELNRITMGDSEDLRSAAKYYERVYNDNVKYISKNMQVKSDCFCEQGFISAKIGHL